MTTLSARDGYRLWASQYEAETAVSHLEKQLVADLRVPTAGARLLDVGCGTGRRLRDAAAAFSVGVDLSLEMIDHGRFLRREGLDLLAVAAADVRALPVATASFDVVWCRLVIGHVRDLDAAYAELSRVCRAGGAVIVTDISAAAIAAGHRRTFRDAEGVTREVEHFVHTLRRHETAARDAALVIEQCTEGVVGPAIRAFYETAGRLDAYDAQRGLPLVTALLMRKMAA
jgi:malonyl-CoA O-methyltransferase